MKQLILGVALMAGVISAKAACIDWKYTGTSSQKDYSVYLILGTSAKTSWDSVSAIENAAVKVGGSGTIAYKSQKYTASGTMNDNELTSTSASFYYVLVSSDASTYQVSTVIDGAAFVYDPTNQQSSPGTFNTSNSAASWSAAKEFSGVPEPTSGLLLMIGIAGLALKRKIA